MLFVPHDLRLRMQAEEPRVVRSADEIESILNTAGLRPTRQRTTLGVLLFRGEHRHVTADGLYREALDTGVSLSLATVYNALNQFADAGLLRRFAIDGTRTYFDTDAGDNHHFYIEAEDRIIDIPRGSICLDHLPVPPEGYAITKVDVVIRLKRIQPHEDKEAAAPSLEAATSALPVLVETSRMHSTPATATNP